jgi:hypothetical protein
MPIFPDTISTLQITTILEEVICNVGYAKRWKELGGYYILPSLETEPLVNTLRIKKS